MIKTAMLLKARPDFCVFAGTGCALLPLVSIGAVGRIMAMADAFENVEIERAKKIQWAFSEINFVLTAGYGVPGLKYAMDKTGFYGGDPRKPLLPASEPALSHLDRLIEELSEHFEL